MRRLLLLSTIAALVLPSAGANAATGHTVDLASGRLDGRRILGRTVAGVTAALGRPDFHAGPRTRYRVGWGSPNDFSIEVLFHASGGAQHASSIVLERGPIRDAKVGDLLERGSRALQAAIRAQYEDTFRLLRPYACKSHSRCVGEFAPRSGSVHLTFGTTLVRGTWLTIWQPLPAR